MCYCLRLHVACHVVCYGGKTSLLWSLMLFILTKGLIMVRTRTTQRLPRSREPVLVLRRLVLVSGPIKALAAASPRRKDKMFGRHMSGPCGGRKEVPEENYGSIIPLALRRRRTIISPLEGRSLPPPTQTHLHTHTQTHTPISTYSNTHMTPPLTP